MKETINFNDFLRVDIRIGTIISAEVNSKARNPAYILHVDFGEEIGVKGSSAQVCENYAIAELIGTQVISIVNFLPKRVAGFKSEVLILAVVDNDVGTVLVRPDQKVSNGTALK